MPLRLSARLPLQMPKLPASINRNEFLRAFRELDEGVEHAFADSTKYDVIYEGKRYPPKAVVGLAASYIAGESYTPYDFTAGIGSRCFRLLEDKGFPIVRKQDAPLYPDEVPETRRTEGKRVRVYVNKYERDPAKREACIDHYGPVCQACEVDMGTTYGPELGGGFVHVHHLVPLADVGERETDAVRDLVPLCPNCHAMVHQKDPPLSVEDLRELIRQHRKGGADISVH